LKISGTVINVNGGPEDNSTPKLNAAGNIINPAKIPANVSPITVYNALLPKFYLSDI